MCCEVRHLKVPGGKGGKRLTLGDYIDRSPKEYFAKVMLEEIVFNTWFGGRTVLIGDACHKMNPSGGAGGNIAMHDAVTLANWIATLNMATVGDIEHVFHEYKTERYPIAMAAFESSQMFTKNLGKNAMAILIRACMKRMPLWLWKRIGGKILAARCQASFLPQIEDNPPLKPLYQPSLHKTRAILKEQAEKRKSATTESRPIDV
ncbi:hypothetical protein BG000_001615 [Podila horticola]|nr:hypothetical protein BG000_001615 [Podila horticola]